MNIFLISVQGCVIAALLGVAMLACWWFGRWRARRNQLETPSGSKFNEAILALLGLLLAFTFSMSLVKHEQRRQMVVTDSNAIGDFYTCASLLKEPLRGQLQAELRSYVEERLELGRTARSLDDLEQYLEGIGKKHDQMQALVSQAVNEGTPVTVPLVNTLNGMTSSHASRLAAVRDRLPSSIVVLLFLAAVVAMMLMGWQQGVSNERRIGAMVGFTVLVCMVVWVILDLNQPHLGMITVSQEPLERLLQQMRSGQ